MNKIQNILYKMSILILVVASVSGCDFFRSLAGRPTSAEIEIKRQMIARAEAAHQAMLDSVKAVEKQLADSLAIVDSLQRMNVSIISPSKLGGLKSTEIKKHYYIIVGSFMDRNNAQRQLSNMQKAGHEGEIMQFKNGYSAVAICGSESRVAVSDTMARLLSVGAIDKNSWILENQ